MNKKIIGFAALLALLVLLGVPSALAKIVETPPQAHGPPVHVNDGDPGYIFVTSQQLYYRTIVPYAGGNLVYNGHNGGSFQQLYPPGITDYGPGDPGYRGGRWWIDSQADGPLHGVKDAADTYFLCPLQGPGMPELPPT